MMAAQARAVCAARRNLQLLQDPQGLVCQQTSVQLALCLLVQVLAQVLALVLAQVLGLRTPVCGRYLTMGVQVPAAKLFDARMAGSICAGR